MSTRRARQSVGQAGDDLREDAVDLDRRQRTGRVVRRREASRHRQDIDTRVAGVDKPIQVRHINQAAILSSVSVSY